MMRIITGSARGARLETLEGEATRPTSERVKEAVFSMIQFDLEGRLVLDIFGGSGQLALEALSRGAAKATIADVSRDAVNIITANAKKTKLYDRCRISACDYIMLLRGLANKEQYNIVFIDPPYASELVPDVLSRLYNGKICAPHSIVVCETGNADVFGGNAELSGKFEILRSAKYSKSYITLLTPKYE